MKFYVVFFFTCLATGSACGKSLHFQPNRNIMDMVQYVFSGDVKQYHITVEPEVTMNATELIESKGYPCESYDVVTPDGYILTMQRIPYGKGQKPGPRPAVLVMHGLLGASTDFITNPANESLAFILADAGFDVWLGNCRGNTYGRRNTHLTPDQKEFWEFTWDQFALVDLPTMVSEVVQKTNQPKIFYIGFSEGTMMGFAGFSHNKTLGRQIKAFFALGPVTTVTYTTSPIRILAPFSKDIAFLLAIFGENDFLPRSAVMDWLAKYGCVEELTKILCTNFLFLICGADIQQLNQTRLPVYLGHTPAGTSSRNMVHFGQLILDKKFQMFDFGSEEQNMKHYNQKTPPEYHPEDLETPVALFWGGKDKLADKRDVQGLIRKLKTLIKSTEVPTFEHLDFIWAMDAVTPVYNPLIAMLKQYSD